MNFLQHGSLYQFVIRQAVQVIYLIDTCNFLLILIDSELLKRWKKK
jgi:hypothetical protein